MEGGKEEMAPPLLPTPRGMHKVRDRGYAFVAAPSLQHDGRMDAWIRWMDSVFGQGQPNNIVFIRQLCDRISDAFNGYRIKPACYE